MKTCFLIVCFFTVISLDAQIIGTPLAGKPIDESPWFQYIDNFQSYDTVYLGIDPNQFPSLINQTISIYIIESKTPDSLSADPVLIDVRGEEQTIAINGAGIQENIFILDQSFLLEDQSGHSLGVRYDLVLDADNNGILSPGDVIDGWDIQRAGFYKVHNTSEPGPFVAMVENYENNNFWLNKRIYYPENINSLGELPLVIVSHGWTYDYFMYDYIGEHLASYGYIVVIHANNVGTGGTAATHSASLTTLDNTDHFIGVQGEIFSGVFEGHIDTNKIAFLGHSTGGEGIVRAYTRILNDEYIPDNFDFEDVKLLCPFAPTAWLTKQHVDPGNTNFHLFSAAADTDCSLFASPESGWQQSFSIFERSTGNRQLTYIHGAGHTDLNGCVTCNQLVDPNAPGLIGKENTHLVVKSYLLPLLELYLFDNPAGLEYFSRMYDDFHPIGIPDFVYLAKEFRKNEDTHKLIIDDYQTNQDLNESSSGTSVSFNLDNIFEIEMRDNDMSFNWTGRQQSNGFSRSKLGDEPRCLILDWYEDGNWYYSIDIPEFQDSLAFEYLSFRACQGTRHPNTDLLEGGLSFLVSLIDGSGNTATISTTNYGLINQPYQRDGGWANEFETVIFRLSDFAMDNPALNLTDLASLRFVFGSNDHSAYGRLAVDDIELTGTSETFLIPFTTNISLLQKIQDVMVAPNPVRDILIIQNLYENDVVYIYDHLGQLIQILPNQGYEIRYNMKHFEPGMYFLNFRLNGKRLTKKLIKL